MYFPVKYLYQYTPSHLFSVVILDNHSPDGTVFFLEEFQKNYDNLCFLESKKNLGIIEGRNVAYEVAKNCENFKYVMFLDESSVIYSELT